MINTQLNISGEQARGFIEAAASRSEKSAGLLMSVFKEFSASEGKRGEFKETHGFVPSNITFSPTYWCNLSCLDCYPNSKGNSPELKKETIDRAIKESVEKWSVPFFTITGGESLYHSIGIAERHPKRIFQLYTNGLLIDKGIAAKIAHLGNLFPLISIEGWKTETDRIRGEGVYDKAMAVMDILTEAGIFWGVSFKLTSNNAEVYDNQDFLGMLMGKGAMLGRFLTYMPTGRNKDFAKVPSKKDRQKQGEALQKLDGKFYAMDYINNPGVVNGCAAAGLRYVHINPWGGVEPCVFMGLQGRFNLTNAYEGFYEGVGCLEDVLIKDPLFGAIRERAINRPPGSCCMVIDSPQELQEIKRGQHYLV